MFRDRAAGTLTLGVCMIAAGVLFLLSAAFHVVSFALILSYWPVILILFGVEILLSTTFNGGQQLRFSGVSVLLLILLTLFSISVGALGYAAERSGELWRFF